MTQHTPTKDRLRYRLNFVDHAPVDIQAFVQVEPDSLEQCGRLDLLTRGNNLLQRHAGSDSKTSLRDDRSFIEIHRHEVGGDTNDFHALLIGLAISLRAREAG